MVAVKPYCKKFKPSFHISCTSLENFLETLGEKFNVNFNIQLSAPITINTKHFECQTLEETLEKLSQKYCLTYEIINNDIFIKNQEFYTKIYSLKYFYEDQLNKLPSFFDKNIEKQNIKAISTVENNQKSIFWEEVEKNIKKISKDNYSIDKYNGLIHVYGNRTIHEITQKYIESITQKLYEQVLIECRVVEISTEIERSLDLQPILLNIQKESSLLPISISVSNFITQCRKIYNNVNIKASTDMSMLLMSQNTGRILSSQIDFFSETEISENIKGNFRSSHSQYQKNEYGFSMSVVPLIMEDNSILLKICPSLSVPQAKSLSINNGPKNIQRREFNTIIKTFSGITQTLGGLYIEYDEESKGIGSNFPILKYFINKKVFVKKKSYFILFIKVKLLS